MSDVWAAMAARLTRSAGMECATCGLPHPSGAAALLGDGDWCTCCVCCDGPVGAAVAVLRRERRADCERRNHPGLRCSEKVHGSSWIPLGLEELRWAVGALEAELEGNR